MIVFILLEERAISEKLIWWVCTTIKHGIIQRTSVSILKEDGLVSCATISILGHYIPFFFTQVDTYFFGILHTVHS